MRTPDGLHAAVDGRHAVAAEAGAEVLSGLLLADLRAALAALEVALTAQGVRRVSVRPGPQTCPVRAADPSPKARVSVRGTPETA